MEIKRIGIKPILFIQGGYGQLLDMMCENIRMYKKKYLRAKIFSQ
jgi:hypothetical protein